MAVNWAKKLEQVKHVNENAPKGDDWFTTKEFRKETGFGVTRCHQMLKELIKDGKLEVHKGSKWNEEQKQLTRSVWYRFIK